MVENCEATNVPAVIFGCCGCISMVVQGKFEREGVGGEKNIRSIRHM